MFKEVKVNATFNERTGYGIHASNFFPKLLDLVAGAKGENGTATISLLDTVSASQIKDFPTRPSILYNVWESTEQPAEFIEKLKNYDQLWVASEWQRAASIAQGVPEEFVKVVPEGVDPDVYKPKENEESLLGAVCPKCGGYLFKDKGHHCGTFNFVYVGQWQPRKSTEEVCRAFIKAFPTEENVRLYLSADTLFPSDEYKSTEERLKAYGLEDPRIIVVHFEERADYIRRLQNAHCFVSCARSEGWGLPIIEAMACGIPTIVSDWGGTTEYHEGAVTVPIVKLIKPFGIYGNWNVPGYWCEPDFEVLVEKLRDVYQNYGKHKEVALKISDKIRDKFSWEKAAEKGFFELKQLSDSYLTGTSFATNCETNTMANLSEDEIRQYALSHGWRINSMERERSIFVIGTWPNSQEKLDTLMETIGQVKKHGFPVAVVTHYPLPAVVTEEVDYVIYEKKNVLSDDWRATYYRNNNGRIETATSRIPYHGVACLNNMRNAIDFLFRKYDRMFYLEYDSEVDLDEFVSKTYSSDKKATFIRYEERGIRTDVWSGYIGYLHARFPIVNSWAEYTKDMKDINSEYVLEFWLTKFFPNEEINVIDFDINNRFDQTDREVWPDDVFQLSFWNGPMLNIPGISRRVYDVNFIADGKVVFSTPQKVGTWSMANIKYFVPWTVTAWLDGVEKFRSTLDIAGKRVLIQMGSKALGDTIAWMPYVDEFRKKHNCHVVCSGWWQEIFDYPEIEFIKPGSAVNDITAAYSIGCFDNQPDMNPKNWREVPLQKVAADILGLEYEPIRAKLKTGTIPGKPYSMPPYFCFSEFSTMRNKQWNREGAWQKLVDEVKALGYDAVSISAEPSQLNGVLKHNSQGIHETIEDIRNCDFYIGLNHGPAWLAYALGVPTIMITGVSEEWNDFPVTHRIAINHDVCGIGCFNDPSLPIDRGWEWCPRGKNYACTREITEEMVMEKVKWLVKGEKYAGENDQTSEREVSG